MTLNRYKNGKYLKKPTKENDVYDENGKFVKSVSDAELVDGGHINSNEYENLAGAKDDFIDKANEVLKKIGKCGYVVVFDEETDVPKVVTFGLDGKYVEKIMEVTGECGTITPVDHMLSCERYDLAAKLFQKCVFSLQIGMRKNIPEEDSEYFEQSLRETYSKTIKRLKKEISKSDELKKFLKDD